MHRFAFLLIVGVVVGHSAAVPRTKAFIFSYNIVGEGHQTQGGGFPVAGSEMAQALAVQNIQEDFPDYSPPLTADGSFAPPPPPPPPLLTQVPPSTGPYQPIFGTGLFSPFFPNFSYFSYVTPNSQFFFMFI